MAGPSTLELTTPTPTQVRVVRALAAPRELVFEAYTTPDLIKRWLLGPEGWTMPVCEVDLRPGGGYRYVWRKEGEGELALTGRFEEVEPPERIVSRESYAEDWTGGETLIVTEFEAQEDGGTLVRMTIEYSSPEAREAAVRTGMVEGMEVGFRRLEEALAGRAG